MTSNAVRRSSSSESSGPSRSRVRCSSSTASPFLRPSRFRMFAYANILNLDGRRKGEAVELLQRTRERLGPEDSELDERLTALLVIASQFEPELYPIAVTQIGEHANRGREATGLLLVIGSIDAARHGHSRERAIDLGRRAIASDLVNHEDR